MIVLPTQYHAQNSYDAAAIVRPASQNTEKIRGIIGEFSIAQCADMRKKAAYYTNCDKKTEDGTLTQADKEAWWDFIKHYLHDHYSLAMALKTGKYDAVLDRKLCLADFNYNQLFKIYNLPTVHTENHEIVIGNKIKAKIDDASVYRFKRNLFSVCHRDNRFQEWRMYQYAHCQDGKCAWCEKPVEYSKTEVDHIQPLYFGGKNVSWNLVIACRHCNRKKCADKFGWNDNFDIAKLNRKPSWIKDNQKNELWPSIIATARANMASYEKKTSMTNNK